jgi:hypothetical protein
MKRPPLSKEGLATRYYNLVTQQRDGENLLAASAAGLATLRDWAKESGLERELRELEHPRPMDTPEWEATTRVRVRTAYSLWGKNPYGEQDLYQAGADAVVDLPHSIVRRLGDRVEPVPAGTELRAVPAPVGTPMMEE